MTGADGHVCNAFPNRFWAYVSTVRTSNNRFVAPIELNYYLLYDRYLRRERKEILDAYNIPKELRILQDLGKATYEFVVMDDAPCLRAYSEFLETTHWPYRLYYLNVERLFTIHHHGLQHHFENVVRCCDHPNPAAATLCTYFQGDIPVLVSYTAEVDRIPERVDMHFLSVDKRIHIEPSYFDIPDQCLV